MLRALTNQASHYVDRCCVVLLAFALCTAGSAAPSIDAAPAIHAATIDRNPFGFVDAKGVPQGVSVDVYRLVAERLGRPLHVDFDRVERITAGLATAKFDLAIMFQHDELAATTIALGPLLEVPTGVLARTPLSGYHQLGGLRIGYIEATPFDDRFESDAALTKVAFPSVAHAFSAYVDGSIDAIAGPLQYLFYQAPEYAARNGTLFKVLLLQNRAMWLYVRTAAFSESERAVITRSIDQMIETNMIESFSDHYFGTRTDVR
jgi:ABC-type amino acid transport substrate-binding protein